jgi:glyoxylase-like metal-dependent hydrolase (beta-lactamase superfamily II)
MCVYVGDSLFSGDTLFARSIGRTDFPGSSFAALKKSIEEKLYTLPADTMVYPGHMEPTTIGIEKEQNPFV